MKRQKTTIEQKTICNSLIGTYIRYTANVIEQQANENEPGFCPFKELDSTGYFFPGRPAIRKITPIALSNPKEEIVCNKDYKLAGKFGAGTLCFFCAEHRFCIGFVVLTSSESVQHVYNVLITRFNHMPSVIIYDNGCNLHEYILNRTPWYFVNTMVLCDGFHWQNHINCCDGYNSKLYPFLAGISTVLHEQKNSRIAKLKSTSIHMKFESFSWILMYFLNDLNKYELKKRLQMYLSFL